MPVNLYLMPALIMIGYLVRYEHPADVISFLSQLRFVENNRAYGSDSYRTIWDISEQDLFV